MLDGNVLTAIFFGFGASMLGITGFESSSNYVEEQAPGVFRKTLRNMWALVTVFNVGLGASILAVLPLGGPTGIYANADALLAKIGREALGSWFESWICVDAFVVLCGAVLTSYVGICGLVRRLSTDRVLPSFLAKTNKARGTNHYIIGIYFLLSSSLVLILNANATTVNGVYTYAFLGLMALFSCASIGLATHQSSQVEHTGARGGHTIARTIVSIRSAPIVFFCKTPDLTILNKAIIYVRRNEQTLNLRIVHVFADEEEDGPVYNEFREMAALFDSMYPKIRVDFVSVHGEFGPAMIEWLSRKMNVPRNMMFITQPDFLSAERVSTAGVRVITA
ncbi:hypothetical protein ON010_g13192 [Phytophthora cinnamomi]|nr:hypothetical protein ON010_g13192 [Phytophthora cinnamomi]